MELVMPDLTIASYNVLADAYIRPEYYRDASHPFLEPTSRRRSLIERVFSLDADVLCLQEVDYETFRELEEGGRARGYAFARWLHKAMGKPDGVATFVRETFTAASSMNIDFMDGRGEAQRSGCVGLLTFLHKGPVVLNVVNTHFKWDPPGTNPEDSVSLAQADQLLSTVGQNPFSIVCGDFNAEPGSALLSRFADADYRDAHPARPPTFIAKGRPQKLDYILHRPRLKAYAVAPPELRPETLLPSASEPSDHLPLVAGFTLAE